MNIFASCATSEIRCDLERLWYEEYKMNAINKVLIHFNQIDQKARIILYAKHQPEKQQSPISLSADVNVNLCTCIHIDHFTIIVCLLTWLLNESEAGVDLP